MTRTIDRIKALEAAFAPQPVRVSLCAPVPDLSLEEWEQAAMKQQAFLIATGKADVDRAATREAQRKAVADDVGNAPTAPKRKVKPPAPFVHTPSVFDIPARV